MASPVLPLTFMPDGRIHQVLRSGESDAGSVKPRRVRVGQSTKRGKDLQFALIVNQRARLAANVENGQAGPDLSELRALETVGARRRRRWLNDRILRDICGPMSLDDMQRQFQPVPFGWRGPTPLEILAQPQNAGVWEGFRAISYDRQEQVLQRWEQHVKERQQGGAEVAVSPAAQALQQWATISRKAKAALRKANIHTVIALEAQLLDFMESPPPSSSLSLGLDAWGRLLMHGLATYHGLASATTAASGSEGVTALGLPEEELGSVREEQEEEGAEDTEPEPIITVWLRGAATQEEQQPVSPPSIHCSDVILALAEAQSGSISAKGLTAFMRTHVHGSEALSQAGSIGSHSEWVLI